ncbi:MAG: protein YgfX [Burkholderiaceae bacterium]
MSIAVTAVVRPSRLLLVMVTVAWFCLILIAGLVGCNYLGVLSAWERPFIVIAYVFVASACWSVFFFAQKSYLITISSIGQIRLLELGASVGNGLIVLDNDSSDKFIVNLQNDSTLWPKLLLLRLRSDNGHLTVLCILQDSVSLQSFRSLSVAFRWITARVKRDINKI